jgi:uncharacterized phiE125 gp8 family phage protein
MTETTLAYSYVLASLTYPDDGNVLEPVTEDQLRTQCRVDDDTVAADELFRLARASRHIIERATFRSWMEQTLQVQAAIAQWRARALVPLPMSFPLREIEAVLRLDAATGEDVEVSPSLYSVIYATVPHVVSLANAPDSNLYTIRYRAGSTTAPPAEIVSAILMTAAWLWNASDGHPNLSRTSRMGRNGLLPPGVEPLIEPYRMELFSW